MEAAVWDRLKAEIEDEFYEEIVGTADCGPFDGGCVVFAEALQAVIGGEIVVLTKANGRADHAAVLREGLLLDFDGPAEPDGFIARFNTNEQAHAVAYRAMEADDLPGAYCGEELRQRLAGILADGMGRIGFGLSSARP